MKTGAQRVATKATTKHFMSYSEISQANIVHVHYPGENRWLRLVIARQKRITRKGCDCKGIKGFWCDGVSQGVVL